MPILETKGMLIDGIRYLTPREAQSLTDEDLVFIDLRPNFEVHAKQIRVKSIVFIFWKEFEETFTILNPEKSFVLLDEVGIHSKQIARFLLSKGFSQVAVLSGGIVDWERDGLPIAIDKAELMTGSCMCTLKPKKHFTKT